MTIRILLADDHRLIREGLRGLLASNPDVEVVGEAAGGAEALELAADLNPDVVLLDVRTPDMNGHEVARELVRVAPDARPIALSMYSDPPLVAAMLDAGCRGYLLKEGAFEEVEEALARVMRGETYLSRQLPGDRGSIEQVLSPESARLDALSHREREVLALLAEGCHMTVIAERLGVGVKSVETYRKRLGDKLGMRNLADLTRFAVRCGLVAAD